MSYDLLAPGVQRWIDNHGWTDWTPIQDAAIPQILAGKGALLVAPTATGKTEAAILPIISEIARLKLPPIALLYVSPLRALINDQTRRAHNLFEENGMRTGWWHGDLSASARKKLLADPPHALFTTPESIEVILSSSGYGHGALLGDVRFLLIDEIHAFATDDRGAQLMSLLGRLEAGKKTAMTRIALSATVPNPDAIVEWMRSPRPDAPGIIAVGDDHARVRRIGVGYLPQSGDPSTPTHGREQTNMVAMLRKHVEGKRAIVFVNSRAEAERVTFLLREIEMNAMVHHGSIHKEERQRVEEAFRREGPSVIVATSTLELGIDIGELELVVQLGAPQTASSLLQRLGRSGREANAESKCIMYAHSPEELPVALAVGELALAGDVEDLLPSGAVIHVMFHQVLQFLRERERAEPAEIRDILLQAGSFREVTEAEFADLLADMFEMGFLEAERGFVRVGAETERRFGRMNYRDFYSVFETNTEWTVRTDSQVIGSIDRTYPIARDRETFLVLGGRSWRVRGVDEERLVLLVEPAKRVAVPKWHSVGPGPSFNVMQRTYQIICGQTGVLESAGLTERLKPERDDAQARGLEPGTIRVESASEELAAVTYFGSALNQYLATLFLGSENVDRVRATATDVRVRGLAPLEGARALQIMLDDPQARADALDAALERVTQVQIGRFWPMLGARTRKHVVRRFYRTVEPLMERVRETRILL